MVNFALRPLYSRKENEKPAEKKKSLVSTGIRIPDRSTRSQVTAEGWIFMKFYMNITPLVAVPKYYFSIT